MPSSMATVDDYPSLLWVAIPPVFLISTYYLRKWYLARRLRLYGIGKGAAGFQTNVKRVRVTPEIAARIRRGEDVSPAEIEAASRAADAREAAEAKSTSRSSSNSNGNSFGGLPRGIIEERDDRHLLSNSNTNSEVEAEESAADSSANEWLPDSITKPSKRRKGRR